MTVYEATSRTHYRKLARFLSTQPPDSTFVKCLRNLIKENTSDFINYLKTQIPTFHLLVCEDSQNNIRAFVFFETRGDRPQEPKILTNFQFFLADSDRKNNDYTFAKELVAWCLAEYVKAGYQFAEGILLEPDFKLVEHYPENFQIVAELENPLWGKIRRYRFYPKGVPK